MSAQTTLQTQTDGLEAIRMLLTTKPADIIAAHEEARKQMALTNDVAEQVDEARTILASYTKAMADIQAAKDSVQAGQDELAADKTAFEAARDALLASIQEKQTELSIVENQQANIAASQSATEVKLESDRKSLIKSIQEITDKNVADAAQNTADAQKNAADKITNDADRADINARLAKVKLREQAAEM